MNNFYKGWATGINIGNLLSSPFGKVSKTLDKINPLNKLMGNINFND